MTFSSFFDEFPELVDSEFRNIFILDNETHTPIPSGNYAFLELFCRDTNCDCRNAMIYVISHEPPKVWARLRYGWKSKKFYSKWFGGSDNELTQNFPGTYMDLYSPHNAISEKFLTLFTEIIQDDQRYAKRIETHYQMFKEKIQEKPNKSPIIKNVIRNSSGTKVGRNDPYPCNSGNKFKKCCFEKVTY
jgi:hypothetical protein